MNTLNLRELQNHEGGIILERKRKLSLIFGATRYKRTTEKTMYHSKQCRFGSIIIASKNCTY